MKTSLPLYDKTDIKVYILSLMCGISYPLDYTSIHDLVCCDGYASSFDFAECFAELTERNHILCDEVDGVKYFMISDSGRKVAAELEQSIPSEIRMHGAAKAATVLSLRRTGAVANCTVTAEKDRGYSVRCTVTEHSRVIMDTTLSVPNEALAQSIRSHFMSKPEQVLRAMMTALAGDIDFLFS